MNYTTLQQLLSLGAGRSGKKACTSHRPKIPEKRAVGVQTAKNVGRKLKKQTSFLVAATSKIIA